MSQAKPGKYIFFLPGGEATVEENKGDVHYPVSVFSWEFFICHWILRILSAVRFCQKYLCGGNELTLGKHTCAIRHGFHLACFLHTPCGTGKVICYRTNHIYQLLLSLYMGKEAVGNLNWGTQVIFYCNTEWKPSSYVDSQSFLICKTGFITLQVLP